MHNNDERIELSRYRIEKAKEDLNTAELLYNNGEYRATNNRAYYSIFHSIRSVLALDRFDSKKHSGIIAEFRRSYIKTGIFPKEISYMIDDASIIRNASDYDDMYIASKAQTEEQIKNAKIVYDTVKEYLNNV